jgi:hypothetical protein
MMFVLDKYLYALRCYSLVQSGRLEFAHFLLSYVATQYMVVNYMSHICLDGTCHVFT